MTRFLIDNMLSVGLAGELTALGCDSLHVRDLGLARAPDREVLDAALREGRVLLSADRDFGTLLAELRYTEPSVIYIRGSVPREPAALARLVAINLPQITPQLARGCIVVMEPGRLRIRMLPIAGDEPK